jgi:uncharacterized protein (DUF488 family)
MTLTADPLIVYSIGHSDHALEAFVALLRRHGVTTLVDVRSQPYSRWVPDYNRETLARALAGAGLTYVFMGDSLGGRPADPSLYNSEEAGGRPDYERVAVTPAFQAGVKELLELARTGTVAMMCSEGDPYRCHRALLITPSLLERGARVVHIRPDGETVEARPAPKQLSLF